MLEKNLCNLDWLDERGPKLKDREKNLEDDQAPTDEAASDGTSKHIDDEESAGTPRAEMIGSMTSLSVSPHNQPATARARCCLCFGDETASKDASAMDVDEGRHDEKGAFAVPRESRFIRILGCILHAECARVARDRGLLNSLEYTDVESSGGDVCSPAFGATVLSKDVTIVKGLLTNKAIGVNNDLFSEGALEKVVGDSPFRSGVAGAGSGASKKYKSSQQANHGALFGNGKKKSITIAVFKQACGGPGKVNEEKLGYMPLSQLMEYNSPSKGSPSVSPCNPWGFYDLQRSSQTLVKRERDVKASNGASGAKPAEPQDNDSRKRKRESVGGASVTAATTSTSLIKHEDGFVKYMRHSFGLNNNHWAAHMQELDKLPLWMRYRSPGNALQWTRSINQPVNIGPQFSMKQEGVVTGIREGTNRFRTFSINHGPGLEEWGAIPAQYTSKFRKMFEKDFFQIEGQTMPDIGKLIRNDIPVFIGVQQPTDIMSIGPGSMFWTLSRGRMVSSSWNYLDYSSASMNAAFERYDINRSANIPYSLPMNTLALDLAVSEVYRAEPARVATMSTDTLELFSKKLEKTYESEQKIRKEVLEVGFAPGLEPQGSIVVHCEVPNCGKELFHHYFYCQTCDSLGAEKQLNTGATAPGLDMPVRNVSFTTPNKKLQKTAPAYMGSNGYQSGLVGAADQMKRTSNNTGPSCSKMCPPPPINCNLDRQQGLNKKKTGGARRKPRSPVPSWLRVDSRVVVNDSGSIGTVIKSGHGFYTVQFDGTTKTVLRRRNGLSSPAAARNNIVYSCPEEHAEMIGVLPESIVHAKATPLAGSSSIPSVAHVNTTKVIRARPAIMCKSCWDKHRAQHTGHLSLCMEKMQFSQLKQLVTDVGSLCRARMLNGASVHSVEELLENVTRLEPVQFIPVLPQSIMPPACKTEIPEMPLKVGRSSKSNIDSNAARNAATIASLMLPLISGRVDMDLAMRVFNIEKRKSKSKGGSIYTGAGAKNNQFVLGGRALPSSTVNSFVERRYGSSTSANRTTAKHSPGYRPEFSTKLHVSPTVPFKDLDQCSIPGSPSSFALTPSSQGPSWSSMFLDRSGQNIFDMGDTFSVSSRSQTPNIEPHEDVGDRHTPIFLEGLDNDFGMGHMSVADPLLAINLPSSSDGPSMPTSTGSGSHENGSNITLEPWAQWITEIC
uniref:JmjC domain-containing protein n=1 Tax=Mucochytrium quahogii TaxID=96639 RepID=A0A7S2SPH6_9STRA|mmetsp:Transcript_25653/g.41314  ORF Transcript_25653/g.41314 Transcript_25653/m.41314 type:complete len:1180 (+) Transcript_25653:139-3678(+)